MSKCVIVVGGHRTGTSAVAGVLHKLGCNMGPKLLGANKYNMRGHYEDIAFLRLNKKVVGDWRRPRPRMTPRLKVGYRLLIEQRCKRKLWGIKDPRLCFTLPLFWDLFKGRSKVAIIFVTRGHEASAKSMARRKSQNADTNRMIRIDYARAFELAKRYAAAQQRIYDSFEGPYITVSYERLCKKPKQVVEQIAAFVGVPVTVKALKFVEPKLRHF